MNGSKRTVNGRRFWLTCSAFWTLRKLTEPSRGEKPWTQT